VHPVATEEARRVTNLPEPSGHGPTWVGRRADGCNTCEAEQAFEREVGEGRPTHGGPMSRGLRQVGYPSCLLGSYWGAPTTPQAGLPPARNTAPFTARVCKQDQAAAFSLPRFARSPLTYATPSATSGAVRAHPADGSSAPRQAASSRMTAVAFSTFLNRFAAAVRSRTAANGDSTHWWSGDASSAPSGTRRTSRAAPSPRRADAPPSPRPSSWPTLETPAFVARLGPRLGIRDLRQQLTGLRLQLFGRRRAR